MLNMRVLIVNCVSRFLKQRAFWLSASSAIVVVLVSCGRQKSEEYPTPLHPIEVDGKWGYIDKAGVMAVSPQFDCVWPFSDGLAKVGFRRDDAAQCYKYGFIDTAGKMAISVQFDRADPFSEGFAYVVDCEDKRFGYMDRTGKIIITFMYDADRYPPWECLEGMHWFRGTYVGGGEWWRYRHSYTGDAGPFCGGLARVREGCGYYYIDKAGKLAICRSIDTLKADPLTTVMHLFSYAGDFSEGLATVKIGDKFGYIDTIGKMAIEPQFDCAYSFSQGLALVRVGGAFCHQSYDGPITVATSDCELPFSEWELRSTLVCGGKYSWIDRTGKYVRDSTQ